MSGARNAARCVVVACAGGGATRLEERPVPRAGAGEIVLWLRVAGLCGTDLVKLERDSVPAGSVLGHEIVGDVIEADSASGFVVGERVVVPHHVPCGSCVYCERGNETLCRAFRANLLDPGGFASAIRVGAAAVARAARRVPAGLADEAAVFVEPAACVLRGVRRSGIGPRGAAVIQGAGSMGLLHLLVLRAMLPELRVVVIDPVVERCRIAASLGAAAAAAPGDDAIDAVRRASAGFGADAVFDTVGGARPLAAALELCREGGTVVLFAHAPAGDRAGVDLDDLFKHEKRIIGTYSGTVTEQSDVFDALVSGALDPRPLVTHRLPLSRFDEGVALARAHRALKVLLTPDVEEPR